MGRSIAAFYSPDDDLEHALKLQMPAPGQNSGFPIVDITFSPSTQGHMAPGLEYTPLNTVRVVGGTYSPLDGYRYIFFATADNTVNWTRFSSNYKNPPPDPVLGGSPFLPVFQFQGYAQNSITDIAAYFTGSQLEVLVLMSNGNLWRLCGAPWDPAFSTFGQPWSVIPFFTLLTGGRRVAVFEGAGWGHAIVATDHDVIEVYYTWNRFGRDKIWTFNETITDIGAFFTPEDGVAHIIVATPQINKTTVIREITFTPAMVPPASRSLGTVNFILESLGAYEKPDQGRHVIMLATDLINPPTDLYLSWYYPGWNGFQYGHWPPLIAW